MALFGAYQSVPFTNIAPRFDFPTRLRGGFNFGVTFGRVGQLLDMVVPPEGPTTYSPDQTPTPSSTSSTVVQLLTCPATSMALVSVARPSATSPKPTSLPAAATAHATVVVTSIIEVHKGTQIRSLPDWLLGIFDVVVLFVELLGSFVVRVRSSWPNDTRFFVYAFVFTVYGGAILVVLGASFFLVLSAYNVYRRSSEDFMQRVNVANGDIDNIIAEIAVQKTLLLERVKDCDQRVAKDLKVVVSELNTVCDNAKNRFYGHSARCHRLEVRLDARIGALRELSVNLQDQVSRFPSRDDLLGDAVKVCNGYLARAKNEFDKEVASFKQLVPEYREQFDETISSLQKTKLDFWTRALEEERGRLEQEVFDSRNLRARLPSLTHLQDGVGDAKREVSEVMAEMRAISDRNSRQVDDLRDQNKRLQVRE